MKISVDKIREVVETLPIGFYANTRVNVELDTQAETSYFRPADRQIRISSQLIQETLANLPDTDENTVERLIRGQVYHELSHAMLTPAKMQIATIENIYEAERIETLLANYFHNVDFKWQIFAINQTNLANLQKPQTPIEKFYQVVRYRVGEKEYLDEVEEIILKYRHLNWNSQESWLYNFAIQHLYDKIAKNFQPPQDQDFQQQLTQAMQQLTGMEQGAIPQEYNTINDSEENAENANQEDCEKQAKNDKHAGFNPQEIFNSAIGCRIDKEFYDSVENILITFSRKNSGGGSLNTYSGIFNPRSAGREDYRYFNRQTTVRSSNPYGSINLNLFIDNSGSFSNNAGLANQIAFALIDLEQKYSFFSVNLALCGSEVEWVSDKNKFKVTASGGTEIQKGAREVVKAMQKANTFNYNIVLYDGDCHSWYERYTSNHNAYAPFDMKNSTLILDYSCRADSAKCISAKVVICQDYLQEMKKEILKALQNALR